MAILEAMRGELEKHQSAAPDADLCSSFMKAGEQIYLAQVPILSKENEERVQLEILREDIELIKHPL